MSKYIVDIHGDIEGDYDIIKKYEEPKSITIDELEDRLDALHEKIIDSCMEYYINGNRLFLVDADDCAEMVYEVLEGLK